MLISRNRLRAFKSYVKSEFPTIARFGKSLGNLSLWGRSAESIFNNYYRHNKWDDDYSYSGTGSNLQQTAAIRQSIPILLKELGCQSLLDAPCGDYFWMSQTQLAVKEYIGADIVSSLVEHNQKQYGNSQRRFIKLNLINDPIPKVDLILCRDCLVHFSYSDITRTLKNLRDSNTTYLMSTTFVNRTKNEDILTGSWRPLNLQIAPFYFPPPLHLINEQCTENGGIYNDKHLAVWRIADIVR